MMKVERFGIIFDIGSEIKAMSVRPVEIGRSTFRFLCFRLLASFMFLFSASVTTASLRPVKISLPWYWLNVYYR